MMGYMTNIDLSLFYSLHNLAGQSKFMDYVIVFFGQYALYLYILCLAYVLYRHYSSKGTGDIVLYILAIISALFARFGVASLVRYFYHHARPYTALQIPHLLTDTSSSFPSGHTIFFFALATGLLFVNKHLAYATYALGLIVGIARVMGGVHYPSDIAGGIILGLISGYLVFQGLYYALFGKTTSINVGAANSIARRS
ncbi:MAG: hypothetical protein JWO50_614 [Candidatus Kaiserbacteria bacterium]|nr:hypothetical protein [Candidatus Kaiserbacteria bacterium]